MTSRRSIIMGSMIGVATVVTVSIGIASWFWLPGQHDELSRESSQLEQRIDVLAAHMRTWHHSDVGDMDQVVRALPTRDALPGWAGELLAEISATGAKDMQYTLGKDHAQESLSSRELETHFAADVTTLGNIFDRITLWRPGVSINSLELEPGDQGRIDVSLAITLLGNDDA